MVVVRLAHYVPELLDALLAMLQQVGYVGVWVSSGWQSCVLRRFGCALHELLDRLRAVLQQVGCGA